ANMIRRLEDHRALTPDIAMWTVDTWGLVLGVWTQAELDQFPSIAPQPTSTTAPVTTPGASSILDLPVVEVEPVEPPQLDITQDLPLTASERQKGVKKAIVLDSGKRLEVPLPGGLSVGQKVRLRGQGKRDPATGTVGDLYLVVKEQAAPPQPSPPVGTGNLSFDLPNNGGKLELIAVPAGTLVMRGGHRVQLPTFHIGKYPVTQRQYQAVMNNNPSHFSGQDNPVEQVSWHNAQAFCTELTKILKRQGGYEVNLPSETMWEWAARGATKSKGYTYAGSNKLDEVGWYYNNSGNKTHPVGQKKPNELGIYDMSGNVWEFCLDNWTKNARQLPLDGTPLTNGGDSHLRALRGGSFNYYARNARSADRNWVRHDFSGFNGSFRLILPARTP
ncbi:MAG: SUMF1/EgtB/PvdO family nonheme iron enzyme, partial [Prochlorotrichaceae cyanobacterium]